MKTSNCIFLVVLLATLGCLISPVWGAPSLPIKKPPVVPLNQMTGPMQDPASTNGQWFIDIFSGAESFRPLEFHDNWHEEWAGVNAISGHVSSITYAAGPGTAIVAFSIEATIINDTATLHQEWMYGDNSHGETNFFMEEPYVGEMVDTKLVAEFAILEEDIIPDNFIYPYQDYQPYIEAVNEDQAAWYCWNTEDPDPEHSEPGEYYVPTWDFGDIPLGQAVTRQLDFVIQGSGLDPMDQRYSVIVNSEESKLDVLLNRTSSLKVSTWIDELYYDNGSPYPHLDPGIPPFRSSDASVFHDREQEEMDLDFGDAPDPLVATAGQYPTLLANDGARHILVPSIFMGLLIDAEPDGQPDATATGDDNANLADEDGVLLTTLSIGNLSTAQVTASVSGFISAWVDFNYNGTWADAGEQIFSVYAVTAGINHLTFTAPGSTMAGTSFSRWRFTTQQTTLYPTGLVSDGEVEDYTVEIVQEEVDSDFGDAPEGALAYPSTGILGSFPTCITVGPATWIQHGLGWAYFGQSWDFEPDGNAGSCPLFNPSTYDQDECFQDTDAGLMFPDAFTIVGPVGSETVQQCAGTGTQALGYPCQTASWGVDVDILVHNTMPVVGYVNVLMDWNQDGIWGGSSACTGGTAPEHVLVNFPVPIGYSGPLSGLMPAGFMIGPNTGYVWTRFSVTEVPVTTPWIGDGTFEDGESEDYLLAVSDLDFGDAMDSNPVIYPTLLANNGARHTYVPGVMLGSILDVEVNGQPTLGADGDDLNPAGFPNDEDGVTLPPKLYAGANTQVVVVASTAGFLDAWIDWNSNSSWADPGEQVFTQMPLAAGANILPLTVPMPPILVAGGPHSRWRFSSAPSAVPSYSGLYPDGEVEDYEVFLETIDLGDAPAPYPTLLANDGARHRVTPSPTIWMGTVATDVEPDGIPQSDAFGDDWNNAWDEDGVMSGPSPLVQGSTGQLNVQISATSFLNAWIDFNHDGDWADSGEQIATDTPVVSGLNAVVFTVPLSALPGYTFGRFRIGSQTGLSYTGLANDGEVEDHRLLIYQNGPSNPTNLVFTNIVSVTTNQKTMWWVAETSVVYEVQYTTNLLDEATVNWNPWGGYVIGPTNDQTDSNALERLRFYRVIAPFAPPPP